MSSPFIKLKINLNNLKKIKISKNDREFKENNLFIYKNFNIKCIDYETFQVILIGNPLINNQKLFFSIFKNNLHNVRNIKSELSKINGQFLILFNFYKKKKFFLFNDRFASIPIYIYKIKNEIYLSHLYYDLNLVKTVP